MLKRQRPVSPPPSSQNIPLVFENSPLDLTSHRDMKRRRILPPVLDGRSRGWGNSKDSSEYEESDDEETLHEDVEEDFTRTDYKEESEYKSANSVLHELHALNHHRRIFSSTALSNPQLSSTLTKHFPSDFVKPYVSPLPTSTSSELASNFGGVFNPLPTEEVIYVTQRYEDTNKLLGSLFLSRRRNLGSLDDNVS